MSRALNLMYVHSTSMGYGRLGSKLAEEIESRGIEVYDHLPRPHEVVDGVREAAYSTDGTRSGLGRVAVWVSVPTHARGWYKDQIPVMFSMWEAQRVPETFRATLHEFETLIVPSDQNADIFSEYHPNIHVCYLGVDDKQWFFMARKKPELFFNFLIGGSGPRKGTDLAYKAFRKVFATWPKDGPVPRLIMKNPRNEQFHGDRIEIIGGKLSAHAEVDLYANAHCYLQPSRGEGFGLQPLQAIAQGCPTILTNAHGHASYAHLGYGLDSTYSQSAYFIYGDAGDWWEPDFDQLCSYMEYVYNNYDDACLHAANGAEEVANNFTWKNVGDRFIEIVGEENLKPYDGSMEWYEPQQRLFKVITNRDWACQAAGVNYQFERGKTYYEVADVKRILFEAGILAPECVEGSDHGLAKEQVADIDNYSAQHSYCQLCHQKLNTKNTYADDLLEEMDAGLLTADS